MKYQVLFELTAHKTIFVEAEDEDEAWELATEISEDENFSLNAEDYENCELLLVEVNEY